MPILLDSIATIGPEHRGAVIVTGSHGGGSAAAFALAARPFAVIFNDAGVGKDRAGIAGLALLEAAGIAAATVAHTSARIGEAADSLENGVISHTNATALRHGLGVGMSAAEAARLLETGSAARQTGNLAGQRSS